MKRSLVDMRILEQMNEQHDESVNAILNSRISTIIKFIDAIRSVHRKSPWRAVLLRQILTGSGPLTGRYVRDAISTDRS